MSEQYFSELNGYLVKDSKAIHTYDNVLSMISDTTLKEGMHVRTKGYYNINDGGSSDFIIVNDNTLIQDGGSIIELTNGLYAKIIDSSVIYFEQFGISEESVDESTKLQALIDYAKTKDIEIKCKFAKEINLVNKVDIEGNIDFNNSTIVPDNNLSVLFDVFSNSKITNLKVEYNTSIIRDKGYVFNLKGNNIEIANCDLNAFIGIYSSRTNSNIKIHDNILNNVRNNILMQNGIYTNIEVYNNEQNIPQTQEQPALSNNCILISSGIKYPFDSDNPVDGNTITTTKGKNINVYNNKFKQINLRSIYLINFDNANIENNYTENPYGDKTGHTRVGYSDDVYVLDLCTNSNISNNTVINSGENGIDILSCKNTTVTNNKLFGINADGINIDVSDVYSNNAIQSNILIDYLTCDNTIVSNNEIETDNVGVSVVYAINTTITDNIIKNTEAGALGTTHVSVLLTTESGSRFLNEVGHWGTLIIKDNQFQGQMHIASQRAAMWTNTNSHIYLSEDNGYVFTVEVDNTSYPDGKLYQFGHDQIFTNCKVYVIDPTDSTKKYPLPLTNDGTKGVISYYSAKYAFGINLKQVFTNIPQTPHTTNVYNLSAGTLEVHLW